MANAKISDLTALTGANTAADDLFVIVDTSVSTTKKITRAELVNALELGTFDAVQITGGTINGAVIGGSTPAAITATTFALGTNTADNILIADGTDFKSKAIGSLSEISSVAADDVLLAIDTSGGGLKKIQRSTLVAGLAPTNAITAVVEDTSPELGGDLDVLTRDIVSSSNRNIDILPNGTGKVNLDGDGSSGGVTISDGLVDIRTGTGSRAQIKLYCESSNAHAQTIQAQPHSASVTNTLTLPAGSDQEFVGTIATQTMTNKTLTSAVLNGSISGTSIKDEDNMASDSASHLATQQSIKAYVDSEVSASGVTAGFAIAMAVAL
tara:strand:- start:1462 stop:2436 length:975 start_codon:yes stop_codon:yes gene_type:complete